MAPVTSHDSIPAVIYKALSKRIINWKRADSKPNNTGYVAAIALLSAIILGYMLYKAVRWYAARHFARTGRPIRLPNHKRADRRMSHQQDRQTMIAEISVTDANANYHQFPSLNSAQSNDFSPSSAKQFLPLSASTGPKTPKLEWRPPTLNSWSKFSTALATSPPTPSRLEAGATEAGGVSYPKQAHAEDGRLKEKKNLFGFVKGRVGKKADAYDPLTSPPQGEVQAQIEREPTSPPPVDITIGRGRGGAISPPLPPLPPPTPGAPLRRKSTRKAAPVVEESEENKDMPSRPASRATVATVKNSRWTNASIDISQRRTSAVPSPRTSSLYRSRLSSHSHSYTPASPNLPHPPVPPMPSLPAFLLAQQQQQTSTALNRSSSVRTTASTGKNTDSMNSIPHRRAHDTAASSTLLPDSTVPPSVASSDEIFEPIKGVDGQSFPRTMVVTATFTPSLSDELPITIGETVAMLEEYIDGWCFVQRVRVHLKPGVNVNTPSKAEIVDPADTITVAVDGEGNSGAVPRFCVSEWPLPEEIISQLKAQHNAELLAAQNEVETSLPTMEDDVKKSVDKALTEPHSFLPSPMSLEAAPSPAFKSTAPAPVYPPLTTTTMVPLVKRQEQRKGANDLEIATPSDVPDSKFSSWGSTLAPSSAKNQMMPTRGFGTMQANAHIHAISPPPFSSSSSASASTPPFFSSSSATSTAVYSATSASSQTLQKSLDARSGEIASPHSSSSASSSPSHRARSVASQPPPVAPPATPATTPIEREGEEESDGIKRVSKPPLAPRLSRFPSTTSMHDEGSGMSSEEDFDPRLLQHMKNYTDANNNTSHGGMNLPRASDRTVTMPPLSRKLPPTTSADSNVPPLPEFASSNANVFQPQNTQGAYGARAAFGYPNNNGYSNGLPSAVSSAMDTGMGTSVGSKTPSTSNTHAHARSGSLTKRFTSAATTSSAGLGSARDRAGSVGMGGVGGPRPALPSSSSERSADRKGASGPGVVSFKALRTGSSTAGVGVVGR